MLVGKAPRQRELFLSFFNFFFLKFQFDFDFDS